MKTNIKRSARAKRRISNRVLPSPAERLIERFGELMNYEQLAELLQRSPVSLQASVSKQDDEFSSALWAARIKLGRRVYFRSEQIAELIWQSNGDLAA